MGAFTAERQGRSTPSAILDALFANHKNLKQLIRQEGHRLVDPIKHTATVAEAKALAQAAYNKHRSNR